MPSDAAKDALTDIRYYIDLIGAFVEGQDYPRFAATPAVVCSNHEQGRP
jgi:hypothetical protein